MTITLHSNWYASDKENPGDLAFICMDNAIHQAIEDEEDEHWGSSLVLGYFSGYRLDLSYDNRQPISRLNFLGYDMYKVARFFLYEVAAKHPFPQNGLGANYLFHIDNVCIVTPENPELVGIKALQLFLKSFAVGHTVSCFPTLIADNPAFDLNEGAQFVPECYWSPLGLTYFCPEHNILWEPNWRPPQ